MIEDEWDSFLQEAALELAALADDHSRSAIPSKTLQDSVQVRLDPESPQGGGSAVGEIHLPHYWAVYLHYGREPTGPSESLYLVFFRDPSDDPRYSGGYPIKKPPRRLTAAEMRHWSKRNKLADKAGEPRPMIVVPAVGETEKYRKSGYAHPALFWTNNWGLSGFAEKAKDRLADLLRDWIRKRMVGWDGKD